MSLTTRQPDRRGPLAPGRARGHAVPTIGYLGGRPVDGGEESVGLSALIAHTDEYSNAVLRWNVEPTPDPLTVDVVAHLHGYTSAAGVRLDIQAKADASGIQFSDPISQVRPRSRPTLGVVPAGK